MPLGRVRLDSPDGFHHEVDRRGAAMSETRESGRSPRTRRGGRGPIDEVGEKLRANAATWRARVVDMVARANNADVKQIETERGIQKGALKVFVAEHPGLNVHWLDSATRKGAGVPGLDNIVRLAASTPYKVPEQIRDLVGLGEDDFNAWAPRWSGRIRYQDLRVRLLNALRASQADVPTTADLAAALLASCDKPGEIARWQAHLFDVTGGWHFPYIAYNAVNFTRWYGHDRGADDEIKPEIRATVDHGRRAPTDQLPYTFLSEDPELSFLRFGAPGGDRRRGHADPEVPASLKQQWWDRLRRDRYELTARLGESLGAMRGYWGQASGIHSLALPTGPPSDEAVAPPLRHIWVEPAMRVAPTTGQRLEVRGRARLLLITGEQGMHLRRIADLIGEALGWTAVSNRDVVYARRGVRVRLNDPDHHEFDASMLRSLIATPPPEPTVVAMNLAYMSRPGRPHTYLSEVGELLTQPGVRAVSFSPRYRRTLQQWQTREHGRDEVGRPMGRSSPESASEALVRLDAFAPILAGVNAEDEASWTRRRTDSRSTFAPRHWFAQVSPAYPWATPAVRPGSWEPARWYEHPLIGDITIRVAYETAAFLVGGAPLEPRPVNRPTFNFVEDSVLDRHQERLKAIPFGKDGLWDTRAESREYDPRFLEPPGPDQSVPAGRVVRFARQWSDVVPMPTTDG
jgi:hypothetical protein